MAFYEIISWEGTIDIRQFPGDEKAEEYTRKFPEYLKVSFKEITSEEAEEIERKRNEKLTKILLGFNPGKI